uniref:Uncharacterized protein n=1 Tax=Oryza brachyantha TaxID=4533 RepID=J3MQY6_ORYBR
MESRKQNKDDRTVVLALPAPGSSDFRPPRRRSVVPRKKKNSAQHKEEASSSNPIATGAPAATTGTSDLNLQAEDINQSQMRIVEESIGITDLQESTTVLHGGAQIMGEATDIGQQADAVNNFQENQVDPIGEK